MFMHSRNKKKTNLNVTIQEKAELKNIEIGNWAETPQTVPVPGFSTALLRVGDVVKSLVGSSPEAEV